MKILLLYGTTEGQTRKIAAYVAHELAEDEVVLIDATDAAPDLDLTPFGLVILAASLHAHRYQNPLVAFAHEHHGWLNQIPSLFISVSLTAAGDEAEDREGLAKCVEDFEAETGWSPSQTRHVAGAVRFTEYDFFKGWVMRQIAKSKKVEADPHQDLELTDWPALSRDIKAFRAAVRTGLRPS